MLAKLLFKLTNESVDIGYDPASQESDGGIRLSVTLKLPLFIRRLRCYHVGNAGWCFRCERPALMLAQGGK